MIAEVAPVWMEGPVLVVLLGRRYQMQQVWVPGSDRGEQEREVVLLVRDSVRVDCPHLRSWRSHQLR